MLSKKYTVKGTHILRKNDASKLKSAVQNLIGDDCCIISEIFEKKQSWSEQIWALGSGIKASLYFCEKVPFFIEVKDFLIDEEEEEEKEHLFFPTIFFFLKFRAVCSLESEVNSTRLRKMGSLFMCRGPTSRFLISGAHLMIPGILHSSSSSSSRLAFIYSIGTPYPYAIGYVTKNYLAGNNNGVGAFVLHCYKDSLWCGFYDAYVTDYALAASHGADSIALPIEFAEKEVTENLAAIQRAQQVHRDPNAPSTDESNTDNTNMNGENMEGSGEGPSDSPAVVEDEPISFSEEEQLMFCFAETLKMVTPTMLPLKVSHFMALFTSNYPRATADARPVDFKNTSFKKALTFLQSLEYLTIEETAKGVHTITKMTHRGRLLRDHEEKFQHFLDTVHTPFVERERLAMEQKALETDKVVYEQKLISVELTFRPDKKMNRNLAYVLLLGKEVDDTALFPSLTDALKKESAVPAPLTDDRELEAAFQKFYSRKQVSDHVDAYIKAKGLLVVDKENPRTVPHVRLDGALIPLVKTASAPVIPVNQLCQTCLKAAFHVVHELILQTNVKGISDTGAPSIPPKRIQKDGPLPIVEVFIEKRGNKKITVVRNLEAAGFTLKPLSSMWKLQYSTSCLVFDPDDGVERKGGKKHPKEVHLQGSFVPEIKNTMINELGFLPHMVVCR